MSKLRVSNFPNSHADSRNDLGYGRSSLHFSKPRQMSSSYPYVEYEEVDADVSEEDIESVSDKMRTPRDYDPAPHADPFYYTAGNTKLSEMRASTSISPFPSLYSKRDGHVGTSTGPYQSHQYGFKPDGLDTGVSFDWASYSHDEENEEDIYNLEDVAEKTLREYVRMHLLEYYEKV